jgi:DNA-binding response OmpR family regulator
MVTAYGDDSNHTTAIEYGADDFITKPVDFTILKERIQTINQARFNK